MQKILIIIFFICLGLGVMAQTGIRFENAYSLNPLSHNGVTAIHQDQAGFLWIGTFNGLNKYDGYRFKVFKFNNEQSNTASTYRVESIYEDIYGRLWVLTYEGGFHRFNPETEIYHNFPDQKDSIQIKYDGFYESPGGVISLFSSRGGLSFITDNSNNEEYRTIHYFDAGSIPAEKEGKAVFFVIQDENADFWIGTDKGLFCLAESEIGRKAPREKSLLTRDHPGVHSLMQFTTVLEVSDELWFGTREHGVFVYNTRNKTFSDLSLPSKLSFPSLNRITALAASGGNVWIGTGKSMLLRYDSSKGRFDVFEMDKDIYGEKIKKIYIDGRNMIWLITDQPGISRFDPHIEKFYHYFLTPPELSNLVNDERIRILEDSKGQFWLGGQNMGIQLFNRSENRFSRYLNDSRNPFSIPSNVVECIKEDREGNIWIGTNWFGKGLVRLIPQDPGFEYIRPVSYPDNKVENVIRVLFTDSKGSVWAGTKNGKIYIYDADFTLIHCFEKNKGINFSGNNVYSISEDERGYIWLGTKGAGVFRSNETLSDPNLPYRNMSFTQYRANPEDETSLNNDNTYALGFDHSGNTLVATYGGGLNVMERKAGNGYKVSHYNTKNSNISSDNIRDLYLDSNNRLWLATTYGLNYVDLKDREKGRLTFNTLLSGSGSGGISYNDILMVIEDRRGHIWLGTAGGGVNEIVNPDEEEFRIKHYTVKLGLKDDHILSLAEDAYGYIWIGTNRGLSRCNPVNGEIKNFGDRVDLPDNYFSERTVTSTPSGKVLFGTMNGFYAIQPDKLTEKNVHPAICLTGFELNNVEISPGEKASPLRKNITYTDEILLKSNQSNFSLEFSLLSFTSPEDNHYSYILEGFNENWNYIGSERKATFTNIPPGDYVFRVKGMDSNLSEYESEAALKISVLPPFRKTGLAYFIYLIMLLLAGYITFRISHRFIRLKNEIKIEKRVAESKLRFFTNISHEIRTPLTLILGPLNQLMSRSDVNTEVRQQLAVIQKNSKRLLRMVNQILDFRKVQNDQVTIKIQEIEFISFLKGIFDSFVAVAKQKNIRFRMIHDPGGNPLTLWGDIRKLDIVFFNLLSNAFKFTPEGGNISLIIEEDKTPGGYLQVVVRDTGIGIEKDKLDLIFDRFFVSHTDEKAEFQGTGIGLSLCKEYVKLHKGTLTAISTPGKGSDFIVRLRDGNQHFNNNVIIEEQEAFNLSSTIPDVPEINSLSGSPVFSGAGKGKNPYHILIVEDDVEMCNYLSLLLGELYRIDTAANGESGLRLSRKLIPDLIVTDNMMPVMSGVELIREIKSDFSTSHIPVIILSSRFEVESQVEGLTTGAEAYISKPFNDNLLLSYIQSFISQREKVKNFFSNRVELKPDEINVGSKDKIFIERVIQLIDENMSNPEFNVEKLASGVHISRTLFYKKVKGITTYTPVELLRMMRLKKAAWYIQSGEYTVSEVAWKVGYKDMRYFSTSFKKQFGVLPSKYTGEET